MQDRVERIIERLEVIHWYLTGGPGGRMDLERAAKHAAAETKGLLSQLGQILHNVTGPRPYPLEYRNSSYFAHVEPTRQAVAERLAAVAKESDS